jgi:hypothetical protein
MPTGSFMWVGCLRVGSGLVWGRSMGGCLCFFAGKECWDGCKRVVSGLDGVGVFCVCFFAQVDTSSCPTGLFGKLPDEASYMCI